VPTALLTVIPPTKFEKSQIEELIHKMTKKEGDYPRRPLENILCKRMVWMPYHRLKFRYRRFRNDIVRRFGAPWRSETALNAMLCGAVKSEREIFMLFRPNYLNYKIVKHVPRSEEIVVPSVYADFDETLYGLLKRIIEVKDELSELRSVLSKSHARMRRYSMMVPIVGSYKKEKMLSEEVAKLNATKIVLSMCLNVDDDIKSIEVIGHSVFYYPNLVTLEHKENGAERYFVFDLVGRGTTSKILCCDKGLTELFNENIKCKEVITRVITSRAQD